MKRYIRVLPDFIALIVDGGAGVFEEVGVFIQSFGNEAYELCWLAFETVNINRISTHTRDVSIYPAEETVGEGPPCVTKILHQLVNQSLIKIDKTHVIEHGGFIPKAVVGSVAEIDIPQHHIHLPLPHVSSQHSSRPLHEFTTPTLDLFKIRPVVAQHYIEEASPLRALSQDPKRILPLLNLL